MTVSALCAAKHLGKKSKWMYTQLELQKLVYLAHMFHLVKEDNQPLVENRFEAWEWGPVHVDLYYKLRAAGASSIPKSFEEWKILKTVDETSTEARWLGYISECFPPGNGASLLSITHNKHSAWKRCYKRILNIEIPDSKIVQEYHDQVRAANQR